MPSRLSRSRRWITAATWPVSIGLTSWDYMWRSTPMHRSETSGSAPDPERLGALPGGVCADEVQHQEDGYGPLFHRRYGTRIRNSNLRAQELMDLVTRRLNKAAPSSFARFQKVLGDDQEMTPGDEYVVRMPGPWDGPVRVIERSPQLFRFATQ